MSAYANWQSASPEMRRDPGSTPGADTTPCVTPGLGHWDRSKARAQRSDSGGGHHFTNLMPVYANW